MADKLSDAAYYYKALPQQKIAFAWLQNLIPAEVLKEFFVLYRKDQPVKDVYSNTWDGVVAAAKICGAKYPELVAAQWALESNYGKDVSGKNNYFGIKGKGSDRSTQEYINNQWITITDGFIDFPDLLTCVAYLVDRWYKNYKTYIGINNATNRNEAAYELQKQGYATDPDYPTKLIRLMNEYSKDSIPKPASSILLNVPYEYQLDNKSGTGYRECFSSSCAMIAKYYGKVKTDDEYNAIREKFGDSTAYTSQIKALQSLGLNARFITNGNVTLLENELRNQRPVAVGWLHKGSAAQPTGGGHWTCCIGFDKDSFIFNDPNGEADMVNGGYVSNSATAGKAVKYSRKNWLRRWEVDSIGTGWAILINT
jgi:hypothetical protein